METKPKLENIDLGEVLGVGAALSNPRSLGEGSTPFVMAPNDWKVHDLHKLLPQPPRPTGNVALGDVESFVRYVNKHKDEPEAEATGSAADNIHTVILVDVINSKFRTVFDHHKSNTPGWGQHTATYDCPLSPEWIIWNQNNGKDRAKNQEEFAFFIEQNILDVVDPVGATMLEIVTTLKATKNVQFDSAIRLQDGQHQLKYHEEIKGNAGGNGQMVIPEKIKLGIPVYVGAAPYAVMANLRYRIASGNIHFWYDLVTPKKILDDALRKVVTQVTDGTKIAPYSVTTLST